MLFPKDIPDPSDTTRLGRQTIVDEKGREIVHDVIDERWRDQIISAVNTAPSPESKKAILFFDLIQEARKAGKSWWADSQIRQIEMSIAQDAELARLKDLAGTVAEYRDMPCASLRQRMFEALERAQMVPS